MNLPSIRAELVAMSKAADRHGQMLLAYLLKLAILEIDEQLTLRMKQSFGQTQSDQDQAPKGERDP